MGIYGTHDAVQRPNYGQKSREAMAETIICYARAAARPPCHMAIRRPTRTFEMDSWSYLGRQPRMDFLLILWCHSQILDPLVARDILSADHSHHGNINAMVGTFE